MFNSSYCNEYCSSLGSWTLQTDAASDDVGSNNNENGGSGVGINEGIFWTVIIFLIISVILNVFLFGKWINLKRDTSMNIANSDINSNTRGANASLDTRTLGGTNLKLEHVLTTSEHDVHNRDDDEDQVKNGGGNNIIDNNFKDRAIKNTYSAHESLEIGLNEQQHANAHAIEKKGSSMDYQLENEYDYDDDAHDHDDEDIDDLYDPGNGDLDETTPTVTVNMDEGDVDVQDIDANTPRLHKEGERTKKFNTKTKGKSRTTRDGAPEGEH